MRYVVHRPSGEAFCLGDGHYVFISSAGFGLRVAKYDIENGAIQPSSGKTIESPQLDLFFASHHRGECHVAAHLSSDIAVVGHLEQEKGKMPLTLCAGQVWSFPGKGECTVMSLSLQTDEAFLRNGLSTSFRMKIPTIAREGAFISGPQTPEEEILWISEEEIREVPEGMNPVRWTMIVAAARESIFRDYAAPSVAAQQFQETLRIVRQVAPLFTRPM